MAVLAAAAILLGAGPAGAAGTPAKTPPPASGATTKAAGPPSHAGLPDSVLATVGASRRITVSEFHRAWDAVTPPARPDSLTPEAAKGFLQLLIGKECLAEAAMRETWRWTRAESSRYTSTRDRLIMDAVLQPVMDSTRARMERAGQPTDEQSVGLAARDSAVKALGARYEEAALAKLAKAFAALPKAPRDSGFYAAVRVLGMEPRVDPADTAGVLAYSREGDYRVADLLRWWHLLNPLARPRVETVDQVRDLVKNALFERSLRARAAALKVEQRPDIAAPLARMREYNAVAHYIEREVYDKIPRDSLTLLQRYNEDPGRYQIPTRVNAIRLVASTRAEATRMALLLRDSTAAESLASQAGRGKLGVMIDMTAENDSALFERAMAAGPGAVVGPEQVSDGWAVARVIAIMPARIREFPEARGLVEHAWVEEDGERRVKALIDKLRTQTKVVLNSRAVARVAT
jgi:hypothetical protein